MAVVGDARESDANGDERRHKRRRHSGPYFFSYL